MRRWILMFLVSFVPSTVAMVFFASRVQSPGNEGPSHPLVSNNTANLPPKGTQDAKGVTITIYEGDRKAAQISGDEATFEGKDRAVFKKARIVVWPEKGRSERLPSVVVINANHAEVDQKEMTAHVTDQVHVETILEENGAVVEGEGSRLLAEDLTIRFGKRVAGSDGKTEVDRSEKTLDTDGPVDLTRGESHLTGQGFHGNIGLKAFRFDHNVSGKFLDTTNFDPTAASRASRPPEDVEFSAGGPVTGEPLPDDGPARRTRLSMDGGVQVVRVDPATKDVTRLRCQALEADIRRERRRAPVSEVAWKFTEGLGRGMGLSPQKPDGVAERDASPKVRLDRMLASGDVAVEDPRADIEAEALETTNAEDGSGWTVVRGAKKKLTLKKGAPSLGDMNGGLEPGDKGPVEITAVDDIRITRAATGKEGKAGAATIDMSKWVWIRQGDSEITCDSLRVDLSAEPASGTTPSAGYKPASLEALGHVALKEPGRDGRADALKWSANDATVLLTGATGAEVTMDKRRLLARTIAFDQKAGTIACSGDVVASGVGGGLAPGSMLQVKPGECASEEKWELRCPTLKCSLDGKTFKSLDADGPVKITTDTSTVVADSLHYADDEAILTGKPARIVSGGNIIEAFEIKLSPQAKKGVLRGVKQIVVELEGGLDDLGGVAAAKGDRKPVPVTLSCSGPVTIDSEEGLLVAQGNVLVRSPGPAGEPERRLEAGRLWLRFDPESKKLFGIRATSRVLLHAGPNIGAGDRLDFDKLSGTATFTANGQVRFVSPGVRGTTDIVLISDNGRTIQFRAKASAIRMTTGSGSGSGDRQDFLKDPLKALREKPKK